LTCALPGFQVMNPSDEFCARGLLHEIVKTKAPVFMRTGRPKAPIIHNAETKFEVGKGIKVRDGKNVSIIANGLLVWEAIEAAEMLEKEGIKASVIDMHTIKPLDEELLVAEAKKTGHLVVAEEHQIWGGLGSAVARVLSEKHPCKIEFVAIQDTFAESGTPEGLFDKYGLSAPHIAKAVKKVLGKK